MKYYFAESLDASWRSLWQTNEDETLIYAVAEINMIEGTSRLYTDNFSWQVLPKGSSGSGYHLSLFTEISREEALIYLL